MSQPTSIKQNGLIALSKDGRKKEWTDYGFEFASDIVGQLRKYKKDADWSAPDYQFILPAVNDKTQDIKVDMNSWLTFIGIWIAEGWASGEKEYGCVSNCNLNGYSEAKVGLNKTCSES